MPETEVQAENEGDLRETAAWVLGAALRRRWWIFLPACALALLSAAALPRLAKSYTSEAIIVVVQQQVSPVYVPPATLVSPSDAVRSLAREVLSRPRLLQIIDELGLYPGAERSDLLAEKMRDSVGVDPMGLTGMDYSSFKLSFTANNPQLAQAVTSRLASLFIYGNQKQRGEQAEGTANFFNDQLTGAKAKLAEQEERLKNFKLRNVGQLPQEQQANLSALTALRGQLQNTMDNLTRARRLRDSLEGVLSRDLARLAAQRSEMLKHLTLEHPTVVAKDQEITRTRNLLERLQGIVRAESVAISPAPDDITFAQLRTQIETNASEIASLTADEQRLKGEISQYQNRIRLTPVTEAQLATILREYDQYSRDYTELLNKQLQSQLTASLEERHQGQHFRMVDPPSLPQAPSKPSPKKILLGGLAAGLALGLGLAFLVEMMNRSFHREKELHSYAVPLIVSIPLMLTPREVRRRRWKRAFECAAGAAMLVVVSAAELYVLRLGP
jgi:polysaccharide chain length determinant protein (PEP-CTERM system associated)